jgi:predicted DCC family thiol-disulfide oxidoreductase YuxK
MKRLTVLYDKYCGFCARVKRWLQREPRYVELEFVPQGSPEAERRFPSLPAEWRFGKLVVVDDRGGVYAGTRAYLMCLWALREYRELSLDLSFPLLYPFAKIAFGIVTRSRGFLSSVAGLAPEARREGGSGGRSCEGPCGTAPRGPA